AQVADPTDGVCMHRVAVPDQPREEILAEVEPVPAKGGHLRLVRHLPEGRRVDQVEAGVVSSGSRSNSCSSRIPKSSRISASVGFSTNENTFPPGSVSITPYFSATSAGARVIAAIVTMAPDSRWVRTIGSR